MAKVEVEEGVIAQSRPRNKEHIEVPKSVIPFAVGCPVPLRSFHGAKLGSTL